MVPVNEENVYVLQLLDLLKNLDVYLDESYDVAHDKVSQFVRIHGITKKDVDSYIREFPIAVFKYYAVTWGHNVPRFDITSAFHLIFLF